MTLIFTVNSALATEINCPMVQEMQGIIEAIHQAPNSFDPFKPEARWLLKNHFFSKSSKNTWKLSSVSGSLEANSTKIPKYIRRSLDDQGCVYAVEYWMLGAGAKDNELKFTFVARP